MLLGHAKHVCSALTLGLISSHVPTDSPYGPPCWRPCCAQALQQLRARQQQQQAQQQPAPPLPPPPPAPQPRAAGMAAVGPPAPAMVVLESKAAWQPLTQEVSSRSRASAGRQGAWAWWQHCRPQAGSSLACQQQSPALPSVIPPPHVRPSPLSRRPPPPVPRPQTDNTLCLQLQGCLGAVPSLRQGQQASVAAELGKEAVALSRHASDVAPAADAAHRLSGYALEALGEIASQGPIPCAYCVQSLGRESQGGGVRAQGRPVLRCAGRPCNKPHPALPTLSSAPGLHHRPPCSGQSAVSALVFECK